MSKLTNILINSLKLQNGRFYFDDGTTLEVDKALQVKKIKDFIKKLKASDYFIFRGLSAKNNVIEFLKHKEYQEASKDVLNEIESAIDGTNVKQEQLYKELATIRRILRNIIELHKEGAKVETWDFIGVYEFYKKFGEEVNRRAIKLLDRKLNRIK